MPRMLEPARIRGDGSRRARVNVGAGERGASLAAGAGLLWLAFRGRRFGPAGLGLALGALALAQRGATGRCAVYRSLGIESAGEPFRRDVEWTRSVTIYAPPERVREFVADPPRWARALGIVREVTPVGPDRWRVELALPGRLGEPYELVRRADGSGYESAADAPLPHELWIDLLAAPDGRGTELRCGVRLRPGGVAGAVAGHWLEGLGERALGQQLLRVKQCIETGELASASPQPTGRRRQARRVSGALARVAGRLA